jgi:hypothetical protein
MAVLTHHEVRVEVHGVVQAHEDRRIVHDDRKGRHDW